MAVKTKQVLVKLCSCGTQFEIGIGKAGTTVACPRCRTSIKIDSYSQLANSNSIKRRIITTKPFRLQISLFQILALFLPFAVLAFSIDKLGTELTLGWALLGVFYCVFVVSIASIIHKAADIRNWICDYFARK